MSHATNNNLTHKQAYNALFSRTYNPPRRKERTTSDGISRTTYRKDFGAVATVIEDIYDRIGKLQREDRRLLYRRHFEGLKADGFDLDVEKRSRVPTRLLLKDAF
jgi:hypothetical protein